MLENASKYKFLYPSHCFIQFTEVIVILVDDYIFFVNCWKSKLVLIATAKALNYRNNSNENIGSQLKLIRIAMDTTSTMKWSMLSDQRKYVQTCAAGCLDRCARLSRQMTHLCMSRQSDVVAWLAWRGLMSRVVWPIQMTQLPI